MTEELEDDWEDVRDIPKVQTPAVQADLLDDWMDVRSIPKVFYFVVRGYGMDYMAINRIRCVGIRYRNPGLGGPSYCGIVEKILYKGCNYTHSVPEGKQYTYSIRNCDLTVESAKARFHKYLQEHIAQTQKNIQRWEESVGELQHSINQEKSKLDFWNTFSIDLDES